MSTPLRVPLSTARAAFAAMAAFGALAASGCAQLPSLADDPDHAVCELARAQARRGDPAHEATLERIRDLRNYHTCRYDLMLRDRGIEPNSI